MSFKPSAEGGPMRWPPEVGQKFREWPKGPYHKNGCPCEIRGVVDSMVVFRWWRRGSQSWRYETESGYHFELLGLVHPDHKCRIEGA